MSRPPNDSSHTLLAFGTAGMKSEDVPTRAPSVQLPAGLARAWRNESQWLRAHFLVGFARPLLFLLTNGALMKEHNGA
jgi:hypothetical protein